MNSSKVIEIVCAYFKVDKKKIFNKGKGCVNEYTARYFIYFFLNKMFHLSYTELSEISCRTTRDIMHGTAIIKNNIGKDRMITDAYVKIKEMLSTLE